MANVDATLSSLQREVYDLIRSAGWEGKTVDELEVATGRTHQSISARVHELANYSPKPLIEARSKTRKTRAGRGAYIYVQEGLRRANKET